jgi:competence protein ComEC
MINIRSKIKNLTAGLTGRHLSTAVMLFAAFMLALTHYAIRYHLYTKPALELIGTRQEVKLLVTDYPQESQFSLLVPTKAFGVSIALYADIPDLRPGDIISARVTLNLSNSRNYTLRATQVMGLEIIPCERVPLNLYPAVMRRGIQERIYTLFSENSAPFAAALTTGNRSGFTTAFRSALSVTGLSHTVAISGLHISFIAGIFIWLFGGARRAAPFAIPAVILFAAIVGFPPSAVRACVMITLMLSALLIKRDYDSRTALAFAFAIVLAFNPDAVFDIGMWLSFLATFGIITFAGRWNRAVITKLPPRLGFLSGAVQSLSTTAAALIFTTPLVASVFGVVSIIAPITNLIALPVISVLFISSILTIGLSFIFMPLARIAAMCIGWAYEALELFIITAARFPLAAIYTSNTLTVILLLYHYALLSLCYVAWRRGTRRFILPACAAICSLCVVVLSGALMHDHSNTMRVTAVDVGQGQGLILSTNGRSVVIDCGGNYADYVMPAAILSQGAATIDAVILSHFHDDHVNGVATLLERVKVHYLIFYDDDDKDVAETRAMLESAAIRAGTEIVAIREDIVIQMGDCRLDLFVPRDTSGNINERSLSVLANYNNFTILTMGDMNSFSERQLLRLVDIPTLDILMLSHHGSRFSTCNTLLHYTRPQIAIVSAGANNSYGHPASETLDRLERAGVTLYGTNVHQTITITVRGVRGQ